MRGSNRKLEKFHYEELRNVYCSRNIIRVIKSGRMSWSGHAIRMEKRRNVYKILIRKSKEKIPLWKPRHSL